MKFLSLFMALCFTACLASKPTTSVDLKQKIAQHIEFSDVSKSIVKDLRIRNNANGLLEFELILESSSTKNLAYRVEWKDKDGFSLRSSIGENYEAIKLRTDEEIIISKIAHNKDAKYFKIFLQDN